MMDLLEEKEIFKQMQLLLEERREISKQYRNLQEQLAHLTIYLYEDKQKKGEQVEESTKKSMKLKSDCVFQDYLLEKKRPDHHHRSYKDYGRTIASILKEAGRPLSTKELYERIQRQEKCFITYKNLVNNILPKIRNDRSIHVERATKGYWQYRLA